MATTPAVELHHDLPAGTILRSKKRNGQLSRICLDADMHGHHANVHYVRKDGQRDERAHGWGGALTVDAWEVETRGEEVSVRVERVLQWLRAQPSGEWQTIAAIETGAPVAANLAWMTLRRMEAEGVVEQRGVWPPQFRAVPASENA